MWLYHVMEKEEEAMHLILLLWCAGLYLPNRRELLNRFYEALRSVLTRFDRVVKCTPSIGQIDLSAVPARFRRAAPPQAERHRTATLQASRTRRY
jgi:hypothetical protein